MVDARTARRTQDQHARGIAVQGRPDGKLGVGLVLVGARALDLDAGVRQAGQRRRVDRIAVADPDIDPEVERRGVPRPAIGRDHELDVVGPVRPVLREEGGIGDIAVGEDEDDHGEMLPGPLPPRC